MIEVFNDALEGSSRYIIPVYQRGYSWDKDHVTRFIEDLTETHKLDHTRAHFFGIIITSPNPVTSVEELIDGQQRLTTAMLFLLCVRNHFYRQNTYNLESVKRHIEQLEQFVFSKFDAKNPKNSTPRLTLSDTNRDFFHALLVNPQTPGTQLIKYESISKTNQLLANAYRQFQDWLMLMNHETAHDFQNIYGYVETLLSKFTIYRHNYPDRKAAQRVFDLVNHRGRQLDESDLIKNYLFLTMTKANNKELDEFNKIWTKITNNVTNAATSSTLDLFLHYYLIVSRGYSLSNRSPRQKRIYETTENIVPKKRSPQKMIHDLHDWSVIFLKLRDPDSHDEFSPYPTITQYLKKFKMLEMIHVYPAVLAAYRSYYKQGQFELFEKILAIALKYHIRVKLIDNRKVEAYEKAISETFTDNILTKKPLKKTLSELCKGHYPSNTKIEYILKDHRLKNPDAVRIVLDEIEPNNPKIQNLAQSEVEHIMPKKLSQAWLDYIIQHNKIDRHDPTRATDEAKNIHDDYVNYIGNQTILEPPANKSNSNKLFAKKLLQYAKSKYHITQSLKKNSVWNTATIEKRQIELATKLVNAIDLEKFSDEL